MAQAQSREAGFSGTWRDADPRPRVETEMALVDYQKLCPKSGHVLSNEERDVLRARRGTSADPLALRCDTCGRVVEVCAGPGEARALIYPMHVRDIADLAPRARSVRQ